MTQIDDDFPDMSLTGQFCTCLSCGLFSLTEGGFFLETDIFLTSALLSYNRNSTHVCLQE